MPDRDRLHLRLEPNEAPAGVIVSALQQLYNYLKLSFDRTGSKTDELLSRSKEQNIQVEQLLARTHKIESIHPK